MRDPGGLLGAIVARKRRDVADRLGLVSLAELRARAIPTRLSLADALARPGARFIMEVKKASPTAGVLGAGIDVAAQAAAYGGAASAVSVLTDAPYFGGALEDLSAARRGFAGPILAKDFIVDPRQVAEARLHGADAVLVMLSVLDDGEARAVLAEAALLGMDALVEAHDAAEVRRAVALGARLVGINNRDLGTLKVDLGMTERLAPLVPRDRLVVAESGIVTRDDIARLAPHADAFLVGTSLMRADDPGEAARDLAYGRVKICGLTNAADLDMAVGQGASHVGFVMVPGTPRAVTEAEAEAMLGAARSRPKRVGIFRDAPPAEVGMAARLLGLDAVQLHGGEQASAYRAALPGGTEIWAVERMDVAPARACARADRTLFDSGPGGTGRAFDWARVAGRPELPRGLLAGGLNPGNARDAARLGAWALDVCSGLEAIPRWKDSHRVAAFFEALRLPVRGEAASC
ncbi:MAG: bifunctional indole-3-glycerol-phosphate synthase TrpC/phosphoribosylanthranilate isomerase TrpF [Sphingosinicella sp.]|uniref:bifunctional indole-3-glycerol-phosphate synthase TrpC/phosphoribosylanthranilate isomerase TrpF n=1 Tax=Sphingosinicella sp. TaxID=1917971 RepID=UPI004037FF51